MDREGEGIHMSADKDCMNCESAMVTRDSKAVCQHPTITARYPIGVFASVVRSSPDQCGQEARWYVLGTRPFKMMRQT